MLVSSDLILIAILLFDYALLGAVVTMESGMTVVFIKRLEYGFV